MNIRESLLSSSRVQKKLIAMFSDFFCFCAATLFALNISNVYLFQLEIYEFLRLFWLPFLSSLVFWYVGVYSSVIRFIDFSVIFTLSRAVVLAFLINYLLKVILFVIFPKAPIHESLITAEGWIVGFMSTAILIVGTRVIANYYLTGIVSGKRVAIYGAGSAGIQLASALRVSSEMEPVAFIDNKATLQNSYVGGLKIYEPSKLRKLIKNKRIDEVLIAMPSTSKSILRQLLKDIEQYSIKVRILPGLSAIAQGKISVSELKEVDISDLLGRYEVEANQELINKNIKDKVVLITGAGGSIGSEIARQVSNNNPSKIVILDSNEYSLYEISNEISNSKNKIDLYTVLGDVTNKNRIHEICNLFCVDTIYHSAAYKHVSIVEENPFEAVKNNIIGTQSCIEAAIKAEVETFVLISTDKAVRPTSIMGATKRFAELILQSLSAEQNTINKTRMTMVRFGNVIGSSGSAIPLFRKQIEEGGPVTVTHPDVIRYFMSIPEAAELVIQAGAMGEGGDVFVLDMGEPVNIFDLAKRMISLSGLELKDENNPKGDIEIIFTGLKPGEKLYEELLIGDNVSKTAHSQILRAEEDSVSISDLNKFIDSLIIAKDTNDVLALKKIFEESIQGYQSKEEIVDVVTLQNQKI